MTDAETFAHLLRASPLLAGMDDESREGLVPLFRPRFFDPGERILTAGADDRDLLLVLDGKVEVFAREGQMRYRIATLTVGATLGEISFFDPLALRTADVVGLSAGVLGVLSPAHYVDLRQRAHPAASSLEQVVVHALSERLKEADTLLARLLGEYHSGTLQTALDQLFARRSTAPTGEAVVGQPTDSDPGSAG